MKGFYLFIFTMFILIAITVGIRLVILPPDKFQFNSVSITLNFNELQIENNEQFCIDVIKNPIWKDLKVAEFKVFVKDILLCKVIKGWGDQFIVKTNKSK